MLRPGGERVTCPACGRTVDRLEAREYDKFGDRWDRRDKTFEYFCEACYADLTHQHRDDLEAILVDVNAGSCDRETFLRRYRRAVEGRKHGEQ